MYRLYIFIFFLYLSVFSQNEILSRSQLNSMRTGADVVPSAYPIIFIHGLFGDKGSWFNNNKFGDYLYDNNWLWGGYLNFCLNANYNNSIMYDGDIIYFNWKKL